METYDFNKDLKVFGLITLIRHTTSKIQHADSIDSETWTNSIFDIKLTEDEEFIRILYYTIKMVPKEECVSVVSVYNQIKEQFANGRKGEILIKTATVIAKEKEIYELNKLLIDKAMDLKLKIQITVCPYTDIRVTGISLNIDSYLETSIDFNTTSNVEVILTKKEIYRQVKAQKDNDIIILKPDCVIAEEEDLKQEVVGFFKPSLNNPIADRIDMDYEGCVQFVREYAKTNPIYYAKTRKNKPEIVIIDKAFSNLAFYIASENASIFFQRGDFVEQVNAFVNDKTIDILIFRDEPILIM